MSCGRGKASPNSQTRTRLFADSAGYCQKPDCNATLFHDFDLNKNIHIAEIAHIFSASDGGARPNKKLTSVERGNYDNLILLCANCHTLIDKAEEDFPDILISEWKREHTNKIRNLFELPVCDTRKDARYFIERLLNENYTIFKTYGPETDEKFNPESESPFGWKRKILNKIVPNNRAIIAFVDLNYRLLTDQEKDFFERFRQHVDDFEAKHLDETDFNGTTFPNEMNNIFGANCE